MKRRLEENSDSGHENDSQDNQQNEEKEENSLNEDETELFLINRSKMDVLGPAIDDMLKEEKKWKKRGGGEFTVELPGEKDILGMVGSDGLKDADWNLVHLLMKYLDVGDLLALNRACKSLNGATRKCFEVGSLLETFRGNKLLLSMLMDSKLIEDNDSSVDYDNEDLVERTKFLLCQKYNTRDFEIKKTLFKVNLPKDEVLIVAQADVTDCSNLCYHAFCIQYQDKKEYLYCAQYDDDGWNNPPLEFLKKYCKPLSLKTPEEVHHFLCIFGRLSDNEDNELESTEVIDLKVKEVDLDLFFEFAKNETMYFQFLQDMEKAVYYDHLKSQLFKVLSRQLRVSHYIKTDWKLAMTTHNYYDFPEPQALNKLMESLSLIDAKVYEIDSTSHNFRLQTKFLVKMKNQEAILSMTLMLSYGLFVHTNLYIQSTSTSEGDQKDMIPFLNLQLALEIPNKLWHWVFFALFNSVLDGIGVTPPIRKEAWKDYTLKSTIKSFQLKKQKPKQKKKWW